MITNRLSKSQLLVRMNDLNIELSFHAETGVLYWYEVPDAAPLEAALLFEDVLSRLVRSGELVVDTEGELPIYTLKTLLTGEVTRG